MMIACHAFFRQLAQSVKEKDFQGSIQAFGPHSDNYDVITKGSKRSETPAPCITP